MSQGGVRAAGQARGLRQTQHPVLLVVWDLPNSAVLPVQLIQNAEPSGLGTCSPRTGTIPIPFSGSPKQRRLLEGSLLPRSVVSIQNPYLSLWLNFPRLRLSLKWRGRGGGGEWGCVHGWQAWRAAGPSYCLGVSLAWTVLHLSTLWPQTEFLATLLAWPIAGAPTHPAMALSP